MKIIYCHHAMRKRNPEKIEEKQNEDITELGEKDCELISQIFKKSNLNITAIYSSQFFRCVKTAKIINKEFNAPIYIDERFDEIHSHCENETWIELQTRIISALNDITKKHNDDDTILCVTSGVNLCGFICWAYNLEPSNNHPYPGVISCSPIIFNYTKK